LSICSFSDGREAMTIGLRLRYEDLLIHSDIIGELHAHIWGRIERIRVIKLIETSGIEFGKYERRLRLLSILCLQRT